MLIQMDFFNEQSEISLMKLEIEELNKQLSSVRKGLFARYGELGQEILRLKEENEKLKK